MDRDFTAGVLAELAKPVYRARHLVTVYLDDYTIRITDADRDIVWDGNTWLATGALLALGEVSESTALVQQMLSVTLSGVDQTYISVFLAEDYLGRRITVHRVFLDERNETISSPHIFFDGTMDEPVLNEDQEAGTSLLTVQGVPNLAGNGRSPGRRTNDAEQQFHFPGDTGFKFVAALSGDIPWGRK